MTIRRFAFSIGPIVAALILVIALVAWMLIPVWRFEFPSVHRAAAEGRCDLLADLLRDGQDPNMVLRSSYGELRAGTTPMMLAAWAGNDQCIVILLEFGADTSLRNVDGQTAVDIAEQRGFSEIAQMLLGRH